MDGRGTKGTEVVRDQGQRLATAADRSLHQSACFTLSSGPLPYRGWYGGTQKEQEGGVEQNSQHTVL